MISATHAGFTTHGTGSEKGKLDECPHCHLVVYKKWLHDITTCPHCQGTGRFITEPCTVCHGLKTVKNSPHNVQHSKGNNSRQELE